MIHQSKEDLETIWNTVKNIRKTYLHKHRVTEPDCLTQYYQGVFLTNHDVLRNNDKVEERLSTNSSYDIYDNITKETFANAAKMFTYLNYCPNRLLHLYQKLFENNPTKILLALTNILKTSEGTHKEISKKIFNQVMEIFNLTSYETVEHITEGYSGICVRDPTRTMLSFFGSF